jgi:hypothetical protein
MNIWLLHPTAGGPDVGRHWRPYWLAEAWNAMGHRTTVVCAASHHLMQGGSHRPGSSNIGGVDYWFVRTPSYSRNSIGRLLNMTWFGIQFSADVNDLIRTSGKPDLVIASTPHFFHVPAARRIARRFTIPLWVEVRDLWPDSLVTLGMAASWHPLVKLIGAQERRMYRIADRVISLLANAEAHMRLRGLPPGRFRWIPNGISSKEIEAASHPPPVSM